jgi:hypothetical protein
MNTLNLHDDVVVVVVLKVRKVNFQDKERREYQEFTVKKSVQI